MVKILQLCAVDFTAYHLLRPLGIALREEGYRVAFCCSPGEGLEELRREGFDTFAIPVSRNYNIFRHTVSFFRMLRLFRRERFQLIHTHTPVAGLIGRVAAWMAGVPVVVYTAHGFYFHDRMGFAVKKLFIWLEKLAGMLSDVIFVQSEEDWREAAREGVAPEDKLIHIGNGVDPDQFGDNVTSRDRADRIKEFGIEGETVVGYVGRIVYEKGVRELIEAAGRINRKFPRTRFIMVGDPLPSDRDGCLEEINRMRRELGLEEVLDLTGYRKDIPQLMSIFDIFVLPSYREGMPRSLIEAMASGLPVVATDIRGCREEVKNEVTGLLVPPRNAEALADAVERLIASPEEASRMGKQGRKRAESEFDQSEVISIQLSELNRLIGEKIQK